MNGGGAHGSLVWNRIWAVFVRVASSCQYAIQVIVCFVDILQNRKYLITEQCVSVHQQETYLGMPILKSDGYGCYACLLLEVLIL